MTRRRIRFPWRSQDWAVGVGACDHPGSANNTVTCLYSAARVACMTGAPHLLQNLESGDSSRPTRPTRQPRCCQRTATVIPAGVHVNIVSPLVSDVPHIAMPSPRRSFETLVCRLVRDGGQFCSDLVDLVDASAAVSALVIVWPSWRDSRLKLK